MEPVLTPEDICSTPIQCHDVVQGPLECVTWLHMLERRGSISSQTMLHGNTI